MSDLPLGQAVEYADQYSPQLLHAITRQDSRDSLGIVEAQLPFVGVDIWNAYELSWLNEKGKPEVACAEFHFSCESTCIVESKSFKLYLNSLNQTRFASSELVKDALVRDLSLVAGVEVEVTINNLATGTGQSIQELAGECLDSLDIVVESYSPDPELLITRASEGEVNEQLYSHLLRSLCPVTGQPDWGSVVIEYRGAAIDREGLLRYLIGYRQHQEFHEQCVERIFCDIMARCQPVQLSVYARYVRRGGLDINPFRSTQQGTPVNLRLNRQ